MEEESEEALKPASLAANRKRRKVVRASNFEGPINPREQQLLQIALSNSRTHSQKEDRQIPFAPEFRPTADEFADPIKYLASIREKAEEYGICKIIPPDEWAPPFSIDESSPLKFATKLQKIHQLQEGRVFGEGRHYSCSEYQRMADSFRQAWQANHPHVDFGDPEAIAREYWRIIETGSMPVEVEYGNDVDTTVYGSGFLRPHGSPSGDSKPPSNSSKRGDSTSPPLGSEEYYRRTGWNFNNLPFVSGSILRHIKAQINGVNCPWLYFGMLFSTFCWHNEDMYLNSMNYLHKGASKQWYGIRGRNAPQFERVLRNNVPERFREEPDLLYHLVTMLPPSLLLLNDVPVYQVLQQAGQFVVTFPQAYHCGFSHGFNCGEAVNFALAQWVDYGRACDEHYRMFGRPPVFSFDRLICTIAKTGLVTEQQASASEHSLHSRRLLLNELSRILEEETKARARLMAEGMTHGVEMPENSAVTDEDAMSYDEKRQCVHCKHTCYLSAVACACSPSQVSCLRHHTELCRCPTAKKCLLMWAKIEDLQTTVNEIRQSLKNLENLENK